MSPSISVRLLVTQSDARLAELARAGHERAFEALVQRYRRPLLGYCRRLLLPPERAEDALQQGLLQAWLALRDGTEVRAVKPWLYRVVHNAALNMLRHSGYDYAELSKTLSGADAPCEDLDRRIAVREALVGLAALPEMQREALLQTAVEGHSYEEAAARLGLSEGALRGLIHRARATLRAATTALTPTPLLSWALGSGAGDGTLTSRLAEVSAPSGSVGLASVLLKAGATAVTATVMVGGIGTLHRHPNNATSRHPRGSVSARGGSTTSGSTTSGSEDAMAAQEGANRELTSSAEPPGPSPAAVWSSPGLRPHRSLAFGVRRADNSIPR